LGGGFVVGEVLSGTPHLKKQVFFFLFFFGGGAPGPALSGKKSGGGEGFVGFFLPGGFVFHPKNPGGPGFFGRREMVAGSNFWRRAFIGRGGREKGGR